MIPRAQRSDEDAATHDDAGRHHAAGALDVGHVTIGERDVEGARGDEESAGEGAHPRADRERQSNAHGIAESNPGRDFISLEAPYVFPESGPDGPAIAHTLTG